MSRPTEEPPLSPFLVIGTAITCFGLGIGTGNPEMFGTGSASYLACIGSTIVLIVIGIALYRAGRGDYR